MKGSLELIQVFDEPGALYRGNIAAVLELAEMPSEKELLRISEDLAQPATSFLVPVNNNPLEYHIRWFAPGAEIDLCGHGSLAAMAYLGKRVDKGKEVTFNYPKGKLTAEILSDDSAMIALDGIPVTHKLPADEDLREGFGEEIMEYWHTGNKDIVVLKNEEALQSMQPDFERLRQRSSFGYSVTARANDVDFVSRTIIPFVSLLEDQATGSSHAALTPFWSQRLNKTSMIADQLSYRKGRFLCHYDKEINKVILEGKFTRLSEGYFKL